MDYLVICTMLSKVGKGAWGKGAEGWGGGRGVLDRRDVLDLMHGRSRMIIDLRIPTIPGRGMSGFHRPGRHCLHQEAEEGESLMVLFKGLSSTLNVLCFWPAFKVRAL